MPKAEWFHTALQSRSKSLWDTNQEAKDVQGTQIHERGKMRVYVDGEQIYSKGGFNFENPQPTLEEVSKLVRDIFPSLPLSEDEAVAFSKLHEDQKARMKSYFSCICS